MDLLSNILNNTIASQLTENVELSEFDDSGPVAQFRAFMETETTLDPDIEAGNSLPASGNNLPPEQQTATAEPAPAMQPPRLVASPVPAVWVEPPSLEFQSSEWVENNSFTVRADSSNSGPVYPLVTRSFQNLELIQDARVANPTDSGLGFYATPMPGQEVTQPAGDRLMANRSVEQPIASVAPRNLPADSTVLVRSGSEPPTPHTENRADVVSSLSLTRGQSEQFLPSALRVAVSDPRQNHLLAVDRRDLMLNHGPQAQFEAASRQTSPSRISGEPNIVQFNRLDETSPQRVSVVELRTPSVVSTPIEVNRPPLPARVRATENLSPAQPAISPTPPPVSGAPAADPVVRVVASIDEPGLLRDAPAELTVPRRESDSRVAPELVNKQELPRERLEAVFRGAGLDAFGHSPTGVRQPLSTNLVLSNSPIIGESQQGKPVATLDIPIVEKPAIADRPGPSQGSFERWVGQLRPQVPVPTAAAISSAPEATAQAASIVAVSGKPSALFPASRVKAGESTAASQSVQAVRTISVEPPADMRVNPAIPTIVGSGLPAGLPTADSALMTSQSTAVSSPPEQSAAGSFVRDMSFAAVQGSAAPVTANASPTVPTPTANPPLPQTLSINDPDFSLQFSQQTVSAAKTELQKVEIRLSPASLGSIRVEIEQTERGASVQFQVNNAAAKEAVEHSLPKLREMFESNGLKLSDSQVGQQQDRTGNSEKGQNARQLARGQDSESDELPDNERNPAPARARHSDSQIDTFV
ncbi:MAG: flagellar hook-length control protein FliK [Pseudomonadota bacterium]